MKCSVGELQERQPRFDLALHLLALVVVDRVPLVDGQHHGAAAFQDVAGDVGVLVGHALRRVQQQQHDVGRLDGLQGLDHRELLDRLEHLALAAQPGGVDQLELLAVALEGHGDGVARGARQVEGDQALFAQPGVDQGRLADVGPAGDGQLDDAGVCGLAASSSSSGRLSGSSATSTRLRMPWPCAAETGVHLAQAQLVELGQLHALGHALGLVGRQHAWACPACAGSWRCRGPAPTSRRGHRPRRPPRRPRPRPAGSAWPSPCRCRSRPSGSKPPVSMTMNS